MSHTLGAGQRATADVNRQKLEQRNSQLKRRDCRPDSLQAILRLSLSCFESRLDVAIRGGLINQSCSLRAFLRFRLRAKAALTRFFSPGFR